MRLIFIFTTVSWNTMDFFFLLKHFSFFVLILKSSLLGEDDVTEDNMTDHWSSSQVGFS